MSRLPFLRGEMYAALLDIGPSTSAVLAAHLDMSRGTASKLLSVMVKDGNLLTNGKLKSGRTYWVDPKGTKPTDKRNDPKAEKKRKYEYGLVSYDTTPPWLFGFWPYLPDGLEAKYCARIDTLRGEVRPEYREAAD